MILISLYKNNTIVSSEAEPENIEIILGLIFGKYIQGEEITEDFNSKCFYFEDDKVRTKPLNKKINLLEQKEEEPLGFLFEYEELAKKYEEAYLFDEYEMYQYKDNDYVNLSPKDYQINICKHCGKVVVTSLFDGYCAECFSEYGIYEIFEQVQTEEVELYTEYETLSKVMEKVEKFYSIIQSRFPAAMEKAKEITKEYLATEEVPEDLYEMVLGGLA